MNKKRLSIVIVIIVIAASVLGYFGLPKFKYTVILMGKLMLQ